jgi:hypothetical protein
MTEKNINDLANKIASIVLEKLIKKQQDWDDKMMQEMQDMNNIDINYVSLTTYYDGVDKKSLTNEEYIDKKIIDLRDKVNKAIDDEDYLLASKINNEILELKKRLK